MVSEHSIYREDTVLSLYTSNNVVRCKRIRVLRFHAYKVPNMQVYSVTSEAP